MEYYIWGLGRVCLWRVLFFLVFMVGFFSGEIFVLLIRVFFFEFVFVSFAFVFLWLGEGREEGGGRNS